MHLVFLWWKQSDDDFPSRIRKGCVGKNTRDRLTQPYVFSTLIVLRCEAYPSVKMRARIVVSGPFFQMVHEDFSLLLLYPGSIRRVAS